MAYNSDLDPDFIPSHDDQSTTDEEMDRQAHNASAMSQKYKLKKNQTRNFATLYV